MYLVRIDRRVLNLEFMVQADRFGPGDRPDWRVTMSSGDTTEFTGGDGAAFGAFIDSLIPVGSGPVVTGPPGGSIAHSIDPETGERLPPGKGRRKRKEGD